MEQAWARHWEPLRQKPSDWQVAARTSR